MAAPTGGVTAWVLGEQLSLRNPALEGADRVLLIESHAALARRRYHRQKLHHLLVAMRSFADELRERGVAVDHRRAPTMAAGLAAHRRAYRPDTVRLLEPTGLEAAGALGALPGVEIAAGGLFLTPPEAFAAWAGDRRRLVMEDFYRWQRVRLDVLMDGDGPVGGRWNLDAENRSGPPADVAPPRPYRPREGRHDEEVRRDLDAARLPSFGRDGPRLWAATADEAGRALERFTEDRLERFGTYQDAMLGGERTLWHAGLSAPLNVGVLDPMRCVRRAERALAEGAAPLNSVEGFVRQVIGWREYVWGMYRLSDWSGLNALGADRPLPVVFWGEGETRMACLGDALDGVAETAYGHHIERLMLFGNLMLLLGVEPGEGLEWFRSVFVDAFDWVMAPNVLGMALHADGGRMMTKPYAAGGRYVDRMSDHCGRCAYRPTERTGPRACPFTVLYWDFTARHRERLARNPRTSRAAAGLGRLRDLDAVRARAAQLRERFDA